MEIITVVFFIFVFIVEMGAYGLSGSVLNCLLAYYANTLEVNVTTRQPSVSVCVCVHWILEQHGAKVFFHIQYSCFFTCFQVIVDIYT